MNTKYLENLNEELKTRKQETINSIIQSMNNLKEEIITLIEIKKILCYFHYTF